VRFSRQILLQLVHWNQQHWQFPRQATTTHSAKTSATTMLMFGTLMLQLLPPLSMITKKMKQSSLRRCRRPLCSHGQHPTNGLCEVR
jgi:hypothetical protein